jgi:hypothetical protein
LSLAITSEDNFNETQGSLCFDADNIGDLGSLQYFMSVDDGSSADRHALLRFSDKIRTRAIDTSVAQADYSDADDFPLLQMVRIAYTYKANDFETFKDGVSIGSDTSGTVPSGLTTIHFGTDNSGLTHLFGHLKDLKFFSEPLNDSQVTGL